MALQAGGSLGCLLERWLPRVKPSSTHLWVRPSSTTCVVHRTSHDLEVCRLDTQRDHAQMVDIHVIGWPLTMGEEPSHSMCNGVRLPVRMSEQPVADVTSWHSGCRCPDEAAVLVASGLGPEPL